VLGSVLARDEAHRREQEARAQAAHATRVGAMGAFVASLAHELTQPLAANLANAETGVRLLAAPEPDLDELRATLADIVADERRVVDLVQKLRRFLRRGEVERGELDLRELLEDVLRLVDREAQVRGRAAPPRHRRGDGQDSSGPCDGEDGRRFDRRLGAHGRAAPIADGDRIRARVVLAEARLPRVRLRSYFPARGRGRYSRVSTLKVPR
jgi:signal transduction histidine kinase